MIIIILFFFCSSFYLSIFLCIAAYEMCFLTAEQTAPLPVPGVDAAMQGSLPGANAEGQRGATRGRCPVPPPAPGPSLHV